MCIFTSCSLSLKRMPIILSSYYEKNVEKKNAIEWMQKFLPSYHNVKNALSTGHDLIFMIAIVLSVHLFCSILLWLWLIGSSWNVCVRVKCVDIIIFFYARCIQDAYITQLNTKLNIVFRLWNCIHRSIGEWNQWEG